MIAKLLPIILLLVGAGAGAGAGLFLRPAPEPVEMSEGETEAALKKEEKAEKKPEEKAEDAEEGPPTSEYAKINNQFVIPIVNASEVSALVVMSISVEVAVGQKSVVFQHEPKLRDKFLQELFNHANRGGFEGEFTKLANMNVLRRALYEVAYSQLGDIVKDVLILELARQDF